MRKYQINHTPFRENKRISVSIVKGSHVARLQLSLNQRILLVEYEAERFRTTFSASAQRQYCACTLGTKNIRDVDGHLLQSSDSFQVVTDVRIIGWDDDSRYEEERRRVIQIVSRIAEHNGFVFALVQDMMMKCRYWAGSVHVNVHFKKEEWIGSKSGKYIPARLYMNEDCDLSEKRPNPEWFDEVEQDEE